MNRWCLLPPGRCGAQPLECSRCELVWRRLPGRVWSARGNYGSKRPVGSPSI